MNFLPWRQSEPEPEPPTVYPHFDHTPKLAPFGEWPSCPKCGGVSGCASGDAWTVRYVAPGLVPEFGYIAEVREHLLLTCTDCGYKLGMQTKNAAVTGPSPSSPAPCPSSPSA